MDIAPIAATQCYLHGGMVCHALHAIDYCSCTMFCFECRWTLMTVAVTRRMLDLSPQGSRFSAAMHHASDVFSIGLVVLFWSNECMGP